MTIDDSAGMREVADKISRHLAERRSGPLKIDWTIFLTPLIEALPGIITGLLSGCMPGSAKDQIMQAAINPGTRSRMIRKLAKDLQKVRKREYKDQIDVLEKQSRAEQDDGDMWTREATNAIDAAIANQGEFHGLADEIDGFGGFGGTM
jgi:hypothetical protein